MAKRGPPSRYPLAAMKVGDVVKNIPGTPASVACAVSNFRRNAIRWLGYPKDNVPRFLYYEQEPKAGLWTIRRLPDGALTKTAAERAYKAVRSRWKQYREMHLEAARARAIMDELENAWLDRRHFTRDLGILPPIELMELAKMWDVPRWRYLQEITLTKGAVPMPGTPEYESLRADIDRELQTAGVQLRPGDDRTNVQLIMDMRKHINAMKLH